ncbi:aldo/keto reductase [Mangrovicoccus algicola]|uniref:Aldo/keto reductase n=1 Tax=Mangrovicoccus algicola TaxID=2771008 RepID=A0A8J7CFX7_9RHOB|nr:aldo/keto reductase [Mangrovicoccus algicola]MBE3636675.1 aldo/keto reductase [Mangrovicoccus algicola]
MKTRKLGANGPEVGAIGLGCMSFAGFFGAADDEVSLACLDAAVEAGIDFWDTSNIYGMGRSERVIGRYLAERKPKVVLATKVGIVPGPPRRFDNAEDHIRAELEGSLTRLGRSKVELYYIHRREAERPVEEVAETMGKLIQEGLIDGWGLSEIAPATLRRAHATVPVTAVQNEYSLWSRQPELGMIRACRDLGVAFVPFSPLARGMLGETSVDPARMEATDWRATSPRFVAPNYGYNLAAIDGFRDFCRSRGWSVSAAALAWVLEKGDHLIPIPGTRTAAHLQEWLGADEIVFTDADRAEIDRLLPPGFAHGDRYGDAQTIGVERYC